VTTGLSCPSCHTVGPADGAWCPRCYLPYDRAEVAGTITSGRHRNGVAPAPKTGSWTVRLVCLGLALLVGWGVYFAVHRGLSCQASAVHPQVKALDAAVNTQLASVQTLATGPGNSWTLQDGAKVVAADAALARTVGTLQLSDADHMAITSYLVAVRGFDAALSRYMATNDDATHQGYGSAAVALQSAADNLSTSLAAVPSRCRLN
jgi:hypothetical protein